MKIKMILIKKKQIQQQRRPLKPLNATKNSTLFGAQNAGNRISKLLDFKFFLGGMPPDPPRRKGPCSPLSGHRRLLHLQWPLKTKVIETPEAVM